VLQLLNTKKVRDRRVLRFSAVDDRLTFDGYRVMCRPAWWIAGASGLST
jgi:hypothetical protein